MGWGWSKKRYSPIAIDFGADSLKLLQVIPSDPPQLVAAGAIELPEHARIDPAARQAFFGEALKELTRNGAFKGRRAICSMPSYQTLVQHLQIPRTDNPDEMSDQVNQQLLQRLNVDPSRMVVRTLTVGQVIREGTTKQEVLCIAASREAAMGYINTARTAKLDIVGMHSEPQAILRAFSHLFRRDNDTERVACFIDLGGATTKVVITHGVQIAFAKAIHIGGDHFIKHVAEVTGMGFSEARLARIRQAIATPNTAPPPTPGQPDQGQPLTATPAGTEATSPETPSASEIPSLATATAPAQPVSTPTDLGDVLDHLIDELQLCVRYHQNIFAGRRIEKLIFLGGESRHAILCQKIARKLLIGAQLGDPMARLVRVNQSKGTSGVDMRQPQPGWAVPMGLCLSEANL